ncbi:hypothetical protein [Peterkaempfera sp. SMS 1(5)a]|uniref:hypothetical protein n=1 Tax=Peterkaempfera podocarpi TaxID=3232308 RepID=UPI00366C11F9
MRSTGSRLPALLAASALLLGALTACSSSDSAQHKYGLINDGVITAATIPDNAPFASPGPDGRPRA